jgi:REP element-mobilizing transposase RayT
MDCRLLASDGEADHLHILPDDPPKLSVSVLVNAVNGTSRLLAMAMVFCGQRPISRRRPTALRRRSLSGMSSNTAGAPRR